MRVLTCDANHVAQVIHQRVTYTNAKGVVCFVSVTAALEHRPRNVYDPKHVSDYCKHCKALRKTMRKWEPVLAQLSDRDESRSFRSGQYLQ